MATITTDTYLDGGTARTAGETWALNGAKLTIRTDTRWHANAPASMTGSLGTVTCSPTLGGQFEIIGTNVRWMPFDTGSGTVPAIGTTVSQGGVSGYFLGVWADYTSAPTAVGAAMPATGYIKFREVTGGTFAAGALTGISANATSADVRGWLEVVMDNSSGISTSAIGRSITMSGDWFILGTTNGTPGQQFQVPVNGGGTVTPLSGLSIETSPGSGVYEWYPAQDATSGFAPANITTDIRAKVVQLLTSGTVRIGHNGTSNTGFTPPSGCAVRVPNIFLRMCTTAARQTNTAPTNMGLRPFFGGSAVVGFDAVVDKVMSDWNMTPYYATALTLTNSIIRDSMTIGFNQKPLTVTNVLFATTTSYVAPNVVTSMAQPVTFTDCKFHTTASGSSNHLNLTDTTGFVFANCDFVHYSSANNQRTTLSLLRCKNITFNTIRTLSAHWAITTSSAIRINGIDYIDHGRGNTSLFGTTSGLFAMTAATNDVVVDGITFGYGGTLTNVQPYFRILDTSNCYNVTVRNAGTISAPLYCGTSTAIAPTFLHSTTNDVNIRIQRMFFNFLGNIQTGNSPNDSNNLLYEHCYGATAVSNGITKGRDSTYRSLGYGGTNAATPLIAGTHFQDYFTSNTAGGIVWLANAITTASSAYNTLSVASSSSGFSANGTLTMKNAGDYIISETPYFIKGVTGFANTTATVTATGSYTYEYQIDIGSGWNGTWKTVNGANLSAETVSPSGVKLKLRITATGSASTNLLTRVTIATVSTLAAQTANVYPMDTNTLGFTNLVAGSEVRVYQGTNPATAVEIGGVESTSGSTFSFSHSSGGQAGVIAIFAMGYQPIYLPYTFKSTDDSILIQQVVDRNYVNP
jgi:hypothetical protein